MATSVALSVAVFLIVLGSLGTASAELGAGVQKVEVKSTNGVPRLLLDGKPTVPVVFFYNTDIPGPESDRYLREQVALARDAGVHLYSLPLRCPRRPDGVTPNYEYGKGLLDKFLAVDPEALFLARVYPGPNWSWKEVREKTIPETEQARFADGSTPGLSIASEWFRKATNDDLADLVSHYEASDYGKRILAWHAGGPYHEMFLEDYRQKGPDYSDANRAAFRKWLRVRYETDTALRAAWDAPDVTLESALLPVFDPGRFPMRGKGRDALIQVFYDLPREQNWLDFSEFTSDVTADRITEWARIVKETSGGRKLSAFFYGYTVDLPGSLAGHYRLGRLLECPDVDLVASPYSYMGRFAGEPGGFMCPVDSVAAHGKLWFNEDDTRTSLVDLANLPEHFTLFDKRCADLHESVNVLERNFGSILAHRAGTWWMDLVSRGAFNHPDLWHMLRERKERYADVYRDPQPYRPEVAVLLDEDSKFCVKDDWDTNYWTMYRLRDESAKAGASVGCYTLADFLANIVPACKVYVFANAFRLSDEQIGAIRVRLDREQATAVWIYAPGYLGPHSANAENVARLTGIRVEVADAALGSTGEGLLAGESWGAPLTVSPRLVVTDAAAQPLGRYRAGGQVSSAERQHGSHRSLFLGDMDPTASVLRRLFESAGCHLWVRGGEIVQTDGAFLMVHSGEGGVKPIFLPDGVAAEPIEAEVVGRSDGEVSVRFLPGDTVWFRLRGPDGGPR